MGLIPENEAWLGSKQKRTRATLAFSLEKKREKARNKLAGDKK